MAVTYSAALKTSRMVLVRDHINNQTTQGASTGTASAGKLVIGTSSLSGATGVLWTGTLSNPCGTVSGSVLTFTAPISASVTGAGTQTAALAALRTSADVDIVTGLTVGTSATDVILTSTSLTNGQTITFSGSPANTITHG